MLREGVREKKVLEHLVPRLRFGNLGELRYGGTVDQMLVLSRALQVLEHPYQRSYQRSRLVTSTNADDVENMEPFDWSMWGFTYQPGQMDGSVHPCFTLTHVPLLETSPVSRVAKAEHRAQGCLTNVSLLYSTLGTYTANCDSLSESRSRVGTDHCLRSVPREGRASGMSQCARAKRPASHLDATHWRGADHNR